MESVQASAERTSQILDTLRTENTSLKEQNHALQQQLEWFKRQLFGSKSEKRLDIDPAVQGNLLSALEVAPPPAKARPSQTITYQRRKKARDGAVNDTGLRFGDEVPREIIHGCSTLTQWCRITL